MATPKPASKERKKTRIGRPVSASPAPMKKMKKLPRRLKRANRTARTSPAKTGY